MSLEIEYLLSASSADQIKRHLLCCDAGFVSSLSQRVTIKDYANKLASTATRFEAWAGGALVGLVAVYCNDSNRRIAYITNVSVLKGWAGRGIASRLMDQCISHAIKANMRKISLEVAQDNKSAISLYEKKGMIANKNNAQYMVMSLCLENIE